MVETIVFAMIAAFLGLRLYGVLGKRTGHEQSYSKPLDAPLVNQVPPLVREEPLDAASSPAQDRAPYDDHVGLGLRAIANADTRFNAADFVEGAQAAYKFILEAFWRGDMEALSPLVNADVKAAFEGAIAERAAVDETLDNRLVSIERVTLLSAETDGKMSRIAVGFDADIAAVTRGKEGQVVAGSTSDAVPTHDVWVFERSAKAAQSPWVLVDTDDED
ncbi:MAG: hypothetical protein RIS52_267 [Pseudomonadota bacterium]